jgi:tRNA G37 N-methylase Trm5
MYTGTGIKSTNDFSRRRISHDPIQNAERFFDLNTLDVDPTGGGDPVKEFDGGRLGRKQQLQSDGMTKKVQPVSVMEKSEEKDEEIRNSSPVVFLRFEPFILHVACRSLQAAEVLMTAARPTFKNTGLTTWNDSKYLVAIWGDEGLDMPLTDPHGNSLVKKLTHNWLAELINERHSRNTAKIQRFAETVRSMSPMSIPNELDDDEFAVQDGTVKVPKSYDIVGDVAILHSIQTDDTSTQEEIAKSIMQKNKAIKVVAIRRTTLQGSERAPTLEVIAGHPRDPLMTTHKEFGISCIINLQDCFFSPRMAVERLRLCNQTARGENVLVLFAGICMDALQLAARTEARSVTAVELNKVAIDCARKSHKLLERNKQGVKCSGAAERLQIIEGDCLEILPTLPRNHYGRILAPRPKEGKLDGDQPVSNTKDDEVTIVAGRAKFLQALLPVLKREGGECHWYDFAADHEFPTCDRTRALLARVCHEHKLNMEVLHVANVGSVAMRQFRVCIDFRVSPLP